MKKLVLVIAAVLMILMGLLYNRPKKMPEKTVTSPHNETGGATTSATAVDKDGKLETLNQTPVKNPEVPVLSVPQNPATKTENQTEQIKIANESLVTKLTKPIEGEPASEKDWKNAKFINISGTKSTFIVLTNLRQIMEAEKNANCSHLKASNGRLVNGDITTILWSHKANNVLSIDWAAKIISHVKVAPVKGDGFSEMVEGERESTEKVSIIFGRSQKDRSSTCIGIEVPSRGQFFEIPYDTRGASLLWSYYVSKPYPIAAVPKVSKETRELLSILLIDLKNGKLWEEISCANLIVGRPNFSLDAKNNILLATDERFLWILKIDLNRYIQN